MKDHQTFGPPVGNNPMNDNLTIEEIDELITHFDSIPVWTDLSKARGILPQALRQLKDLIRLIDINEGLRAQIDNQAKQTMTLTAERDKLKGLLSEESAIIHGDGGHYEAKHGIEKAIQDGKTKRNELKVEVEQLREALAKIINYDYARTVPPKDFNDGCVKCNRNRERQWPPNGLCDEHYRQLEITKAENTRRREMQHSYMRNVAREALKGGSDDNAI